MEILEEYVEGLDICAIIIKGFGFVWQLKVKPHCNLGGSTTALWFHGLPDTSRLLQDEGATKTDMAHSFSFVSICLADY